MKRSGFTLVEIMVAITVFVIVVVAAGETLFSVRQAWQKQKLVLDSIRNARWAVEFMVNEMRQGSNFSVFASTLQFELPPGGAPNRVWYWRGDGATYGNADILFRGAGASLNNANSVRQELSNFIVTNPSGNGIFASAGATLYTIELTVRPKPAEAASSKNQNYTLRTMSRQRN